MANVTIAFDPSSSDDIAHARELLERLAADGGGDGQSVARARLDEEALRRRLADLVVGYGIGRHRYLRVVAEAAPGAASQREILEHLPDARSIGGTHASIERSWRAMGSTQPVIETARNGDSRMDVEVARLVLELLDQHDPVEET
jgi:hypothetical protein